LSTFASAGIGCSPGLPPGRLG